jgi:hypothetical protein
MIPLLLSITLFALAGLHVYWACGGRWAGRVALPQHADGRVVFSPGPLACGVVAAVLAALGALCLDQVLFAGAVVPRGLTRAAHLAAAVLFALRVVGDFRFVGVFRKIRNTAFARYDRRIYTPLCAVLAAGFLWCATHLTSGAR